MGQNRNNNYRCDDDHLNKIAQLAELLGITKTKVNLVLVDMAYLDPHAVDEFIKDDECKSM